MSNIIWFDVDGVLLSWVPAFLTHIRSKVSYEQLTRYDISNLFNGDVTKMVEAIDRFNSTKQYGELEPLVTRADLLRLKEAGYRLCVITQVDGIRARLLRVKNLNRVFGHDMFDNIICVGRGESKVKLMRKAEPYELINIVEDKPGFFEEANATGGFRMFAIEHPYNKKELAALYRRAPMRIYQNVTQIVDALLGLK